MSEGKRLFIGVQISVGTANHLAAAVETLARRARDAGLEIRWVPPVNYHVTLKFLGWTRTEAVGPVRDAVEEATRGVQRFSFRTSRLGAFDSLDKASVVWAGIEDGAALIELARRISDATEPLGFAPGTRAFHPHVTVGRLRETRGIRDVVLPVAEQMFGDTRTDAVILFESETKSTGSVHTEISRITFKTASDPPFPSPERQTPALQLDPRTQSSEPNDDTDDGWPRGQGPNHDL